MPKKVAILGGGMSSLTTAFELTSEPGWQDRWDITVYQQGWRLGGKGASGRNKDAAQRIEEHGLHILFGFYENAFRVMRACYDELGRHPAEPLASWQDAFKKHSLIVMMEEVDGQYLPWPVVAPENDELPGEGTDFPTPWEYVRRVIEYLLDEFGMWTQANAEQGFDWVGQKLGLGGELTSLRAKIHAVVDKPDSAAGEAVSLFKAVEHFALNTVKSLITDLTMKTLRAEATFLQMAHELVKSMPLDPGQHESADHQGICWLLRCFSDWLWDLPIKDTNSRRLKYMVDFGCTIVVGLIQDGLIQPPQDWFKIDDLDFRAWLKKHGAHTETIASPLVTGLYDAIFSTGQPVGAGTIIHLFFRMGFTYRGSVLWKMQAGMGDTIFTPLYQVLKRRGVKFKFFHDVKQLHLSADQKTVDKIDVGVQVTTKGDYQPLADVRGLGCWPTEPLYDQIVEDCRGVDLENFWSGWKDVSNITLEAGKDFDLCVFGISVGAIPFLCGELMNANPRFKQMAETVKTCQTQALQLWFRPELKQLGWQGPSPVVIPYVEPYDTWSDMSQLIDKEDWSVPIGNIAYLCSILQDDEPIPPASDHGYPDRQRQRAFDNAKLWCDKYAQGIWPNATVAGGALNPYWLVDYRDKPFQEVPGPERLNSQYWRAVVSPSERYVLVVPNSSRARLKADQSGFANLYLTGDWILTSISAGCLEAATMGGLQTANAMKGGGRAILGDWLP
jgi:uncharacterized protein with NAD-binding domain and iron-sulfur cluster